MQRPERQPVNFTPSALTLILRLLEHEWQHIEEEFESKLAALDAEESEQFSRSEVDEEVKRTLRSSEDPGPTN